MPFQSVVEDGLAGRRRDAARKWWAFWK